MRQGSLSKPSRFESFLDRIGPYVGREWLFAEIDRFIHSDEKFALLVGEPGAGKTASIADLVRRTDCIHYFVGKGGDHAAEHGFDWNDPMHCARELNRQLVDRFGDGIVDFKDWARLDVRLTVGDATDVVGAEIGEYTAGATSASVAVTARRVSPHANIAALVIHNFRVDPEQAILRLVLEPLAKAASARPYTSILVAIDGIDEWNYAACGRDIGDFLSDAPLPSNVKLLVATRSNHLSERVLRVRADVIMGLSLTADGAHNNEAILSDARAYIDRGLDAIRAKGRQVPDAAWVQRIIDVSEANFLYLRFLLEELATGFDRELLERPPVGLANVYRHFLNRLKTWAMGERCMVALVPLLGVLAVSRQALTMGQIARFAAVDGITAAAILEYVQPYLDVGGAPIRYQLYHKSFAEFLLLDAAESRIDVEAANAAVVLGCRGRAATWAEVPWASADDYDIHHIAAHVVASAPNARGELELLLTTAGYLEEKARRAGLGSLLTTDFALLATPSATAKVLREALARELIAEPVQRAAGYSLRQQLYNRLCLMHDPAASALAGRLLDESCILRLRWGTQDSGEGYFRVGIRTRSAVEALAISERADRLAVLCRDGIVELWDFDEVRRLGLIEAVEPAQCVALSCDGSQLWTTHCVDDAVTLLRRWSENGSLSAEYRIDGAVKTLALSAGNGLLAAGTQQGKVYLIDSRDGNIARHRETGESAVTGLAFGPDGSHLVSLCRNRKLVLWKVPELRSRRIVQTTFNEEWGRFAGRTESITLSSDGRHAFVGCDDYAVRKVDLEAGRQVGQALDLGGHVDAVVECPGGVILAGTDDGFLKKIDANSCELVEEFRGHAGRVCAAIADRRRRRVVTAGEDGVVIVWDFSDGTDMALRPGHLEPVQFVSAPAASGLIASAGRSGTVKLWNADDGTIERVLHLHADVSQPGVCLLESSRSAAISTRSKAAPVIVPLTTSQRASGEPQFSLVPASRSFLSKCEGLLHTPLPPPTVTSDGSCCAIADGTSVVLFDIASREPVGEIIAGGPVVRASLSSDGVILMLELREGLQAWRTDSGQIIAEIPNVRLLDRPFKDRSGSYSVVAAQESQACVFRLDSRGFVLSVRPGSGKPLLSAVAGDSSLLVIASDAGSVDVFSLASGERTAGWASPVPISAVCFCPANDGLVIGDRSGAIRVFDFCGQWS